MKRVLAAGLALLVGGCASTPDPKKYKYPPSQAPKTGTVEEGIASWYGPKYNGKKTASGEIFDTNALTAAHPSFAFGTKVKVTLLSSGKSVVVRINDRFPAHKGRAIDVSHEAAKRIGLLGPGTGKVRLEVVP